MLRKDVYYVILDRESAFKGITPSISSREILEVIKLVQYELSPYFDHIGDDVSGEITTILNKVNYTAPQLLRLMIIVNTIRKLKQAGYSSTEEFWNIEKLFGKISDFSSVEIEKA